MNKTARVGSIISGTTRLADLLPALADALAYLDAEQRHPGLVEEARTTDPESQAAPEVFDELVEALGDFAPPYGSFGSHPGDGADWGFWPDWEAIDSDRRDGTLASGDDLPDDGSAIGQFLHVSDHGNAELYAWDATKGSWRSVWAVV